MAERLPVLCFLFTGFDPLQFNLDNLPDEFRPPIGSNRGVDAFFLTRKKSDHKMFQPHFWSTTVLHVRRVSAIFYRVKTSSHGLPRQREAIMPLVVR